MKKHIFGFVLFSLIVGSAVFVSASYYKQPSLKQSKTEYVYEVSTQSCWKQVKRMPKNPVSVKITQAVFNSNTKQLDISFSTPYQQDVEVYAVNGKKGLVQRSMFSINPDSENKSTQSMNLPGKWVNDLKPTDNMYVMIKTSYIGKNENDSFEAETVPVLMIPKQ